MSPYEAIGRPIKPRRTFVIKTINGEKELYDWPWLLPDKSDGREVKMPREVWRPP